VATKAPSLGPAPALGGGLHRHRRFVALNLLGAEQRRIARERFAMEHHDSQSEWQTIAPALDAAIDELNEEDRAAVLARYFERKEFAEIGEALGVSESAAQRRISRAIEKLRDRLGARGVSASAVTLVGGLSANAVQAAPPQLASFVAGTAWQSMSSAAAGAASVAATVVGWSLGKLAATAAVLALATGVAWTARDTPLGRETVPLAATPETAPPSSAQQPEPPAPAPATVAPDKPKRADEQKIGIWKGHKFEWQKPGVALRRPVTFAVSLPAGHTHFTAVIDDASGRRVRNLLDAAKASDFGGDPASSQAQTLAIEWNGLDDRGEPASDGEYRVRGCSHDGVKLLYDYSFLGPGTPPWEGYKNSTWGGDHEFPNAIACLRGHGGGAWRVAAGGRTAEGGSPGFILDASDRKVHAFGNGWTGPNALAARDGSVWIALGRELVRIAYHTAAVQPFAKPVKSESKEDRIEALAIGEKVAALVWRHKERAKNPKSPADRLRIIDKQSGATVRELPLTSNAAHNGLVFPSADTLLIATDAGLIRLNAAEAQATPQPVTFAGVDKPGALALGPDGQLFIHDRGTDDCVKVFASADEGAALVRTVGTQGGQRSLAYDPQALHDMEAMSVDDDGALWIAEGSSIPETLLGFVRRIAVFGSDGKVLRQHIGGTWYGANQVCLHEQDPALALAYGVIYRIDLDKQPTYTPLRYASTRREPRSPFELWTSAPHPLFGATRMFRSEVSGQMREYLLQSIGFPILFQADEQGDYQPVFAAGNHEHSKAFPKADDDPKALFLWSDLNRDTQPQAEEFTRARGGSHSVSWFSGWGYPPPRDLVWRFGGHEFAPARFTEDGVPVYGEGKQLAAREHFLRVGQHLVATVSGKWDSPEAGYYFAGRYLFTNLAGEPRAHYRINWPAVHASWSSTLYTPGQTGRTIGENFFSGVIDSRGELGHVFAVHGNYGQAFVFSEDGLFVTPLWRDARDKPQGKGDKEVRGADWTNVTMDQEAFGGWFGRQDDGVVRYLHGHTAAHVVRVEGLEQVKRFDAGTLTLSGKAGAGAAPAAASPAAQPVLKIPNVRGAFPAFKPDGDASEWKKIPRHEIRSGDEVVARVALAHDLDHIYLLAEVTDSSPALNGGAAQPAFAFKTGDAIDLQLGPLRPARTAAREGDARILLLPPAPDAKPGKAKPLAIRYLPVKAEAKPEEAVTFESPVRSVGFASVKTLSSDAAQIVFTPTSTGYLCEARLRCDDIALKQAANGLRLRADIGVLFSNDGGEATQSRAYLFDHSPGASITADVPSEAELRPAEWGEWLLE